MATATVPAGSLDARLQSLRRTYGEAIPIDDLVDVVHGLLESLRGDVSSSDLRLYGELEGLARLIHRAKEEIREIRPDDIPAEHIPSANTELDAIVRHLEGATGNILDAAETIESVAARADAELAQPLQEAVTSIYEACNFQDLSGQRITKIVATLKTIETRVVHLVKVFGCHGATPAQTVAPTAPVTDADLLNGPQLPDNANSQAEIDALLASFD